MARILPGLLLIATLPLAGCNTDSVAPVAVSAAPGMASLTLTRSNDFYAAGVKADVALNGTQITSLAIGDTYRTAVAPGSELLTVSCVCGPGSYTVKFNAEAGKAYGFAISPRNEQFAAQMTGGLIGVAADTSANGTQSGTFQITRQ